MNLIAEWVMQIIVFILIGTILELLLPNNNLKKYINIVIGLLLLLILTKPILSLFQIDVTKEIEKIEKTVFIHHAELEETKDLIENQKNEIQTEQDAYIWNEVKMQLMDEANKQLKEEFGVEMIDITFVFDEFLDKDDKLEEVLVYLEHSEEKRNGNRSGMKPIVIEMETELDNEVDSKKTLKIRNKLEELWNINKSQIKIYWGEGQLER